MLYFRFLGGKKNITKKWLYNQWLNEFSLKIKSSLLHLYRNTSISGFCVCLWGGRGSGVGLQRDLGCLPLIWAVSFPASTAEELGLSLFYPSTVKRPNTALQELSTKPRTCSATQLFFQELQL